MRDREAATICQVQQCLELIANTDNIFLPLSQTRSVSVSREVQWQARCNSFLSNQFVLLIFPMDTIFPFWDFSGSSIRLRLYIEITRRSHLSTKNSSGFCVQ